MAIGILVYLLPCFKVVPYQVILYMNAWQLTKFVVNVGVSLSIQIYGEEQYYIPIFVIFFSYLLILLGFSSLIDSCCDLLTTNGGNFTRFFFIWTFSLYGKKNIQPHKFRHACTYNQQGRVPSWPRLG